MSDSEHGSDTGSARSRHYPPTPSLSAASTGTTEATGKIHTSVASQYHAVGNAFGTVQTPRTANIASPSNVRSLQQNAPIRPPPSPIQTSQTVTSQSHPVMSNQVVPRASHTSTTQRDASSLPLSRPNQASAVDRQPRTPTSAASGSYGTRASSRMIDPHFDRPSRQGSSSARAPTASSLSEQGKQARDPRIKPSQKDAVSQKREVPGPRALGEDIRRRSTDAVPPKAPNAAHRTTKSHGDQPDDDVPMK